jgi:hypothetical protein
MRRTLLRGTLAVALALTLAFATIVVRASPGGAATPLQVCAHIAGSATFAPGLTSTPKNSTLKATGSETACTPSASTGGAGAFTSTIAVTKVSCAKLGTGGLRMSATGTTTWKSRKVSKYSLTFATGAGNAATVATITGKVSSGLFVGHAVTGAVKFTVPGKPNCTTKPLKKITLTSAKSFVIT